MVATLINLHKSDAENELQYIWRLGQAKDNGSLEMTWKELTEVLNKELRPEDEYWQESAYRKKYSQAKMFYDEVFSQMVPESHAEEIMVQKRELERAKIAFRDERRAWQHQNYLDSRISHTLDLLEEHIKAAHQPELISANEIRETSQGIVICLSDWHIGAEYYSFNGYYNSDIAQERLGKLLSAVLDIAKQHQITSCVVTVSGDLISGSIHRSIQVTNRENIIEQIITASELLAAFIIKLSPHFHDIYVCGVSGNHSRIAKKDDALKDERLDHLTLWYANAALSSYENVTVCLDELDSTVATFEFKGCLYVVVHGDYDAFNETAVQRLVLWLGYKPDVIIFGHKHYPAMSECAGITMVQVGTLGGSGDDFTQEKRLSGEASQTVLIADDSGIVCCYPVKLN